MKRLTLGMAIGAAFLAGYFSGCHDEELPAAETSRTVYEVSEANLTGNGDVIEASAIHVGTEGSGGAAMSLVAVYGSGYSSNNHWQLLYEMDVSEGRVKINPQEHPSRYYRAVVIN